MDIAKDHYFVQNEGDMKKLEEFVKGRIPFIQKYYKKEGDSFVPVNIYMYEGKLVCIEQSYLEKKGKVIITAPGNSLEPVWDIRDKLQGFSNIKLIGKEDKEWGNFK